MSSHDDDDDDDDNATSVTASGREDTDTETEITQRHATKSRKTLKRKRRATSPSRFGAALESLLATTTTEGVAAPLSLRPDVARREKEARLERGARKLLEGERKEREEKGRVKDVIGGWGVDGERTLRKVAQRGVITLFNAVQHAQTEAEATSTAARAQRGTGKATLPAPDPNKSLKAKAVDADSFIEMIRAGGVVSKV